METCAGKPASFCKSFWSDQIHAQILASHYLVETCSDRTGDRTVNRFVAAVWTGGYHGNDKCRGSGIRSGCHRCRASRQICQHLVLAVWRWLREADKDVDYSPDHHHADRRGHRDGRSQEVGFTWHPNYLVVHDDDVVRRQPWTGGRNSRETGRRRQLRDL